MLALFLSLHQRQSSIQAPTYSLAIRTYVIAKLSFSTKCYWHQSNTYCNANYAKISWRHQYLGFFYHNFHWISFLPIISHFKPIFVNYGWKLFNHLSKENEINQKCFPTSFFFFLLSAIRLYTSFFCKFHPVQERKRCHGYHRTSILEEKSWRDAIIMDFFLDHPTVSSTIRCKRNFCKWLNE